MESKGIISYFLRKTHKGDMAVDADPKGCRDKILNLMSTSGEVYG